MTQRMMKRVRNREAGFTLVELLIVIGILLLLAAFVVPQLIGTGESARKDLAKAAIGPSGPLASALDLYRVQIGQYPTTEQGLKALMTAPDDLAETVKDKYPAGGFLKNDPNALKDPWGNEYKYTCPGQYNKDGFDLSSMGPDKQEGNEDDICNWTKTN